jgi:predicted AAA+ superfamily ATPase
LLSHPKSGASWEGYALEELLKVADVDDFYFWGTHGGAELDLLLMAQGRRIGVEFKRIDAPRMTRSMQISLEDLALDHLAVVYPGEKMYGLGERVTVLPVTTLAERGRLMELLGGEVPRRKGTRIRSRTK